MNSRDRFFNKENFLFSEAYNNKVPINVLTNKILPFNNTVIEISQKDFMNGSYIISKPGTYKLIENISFQPNPDNDGKPTELQLKTLPLAFNLGFFAAIVINCDNVILDLNKFTLSQSLIHSVQQTFYANIQIGGSPFIKKQGPSKFPDFVKAPSNLLIKNGKLGLSSHHGIHCATGVNKCIISDLKIQEVGVAGIHINGGNSLYLNKIEIDNKKSNILFDSTLSFAIFMIPHFKHLTKNNPDLIMTVQKKDIKVIDLYNSLTKEVDKAFSSIRNNIKYAGIFKNKDAPLYDANIYGLVLNSKGILINDFKKMENSKINDNYDIVLNKVKVKNCVSAGTEIIVISNKVVEKEAISYGSGVIKGVHGDVIDIEKVLNKNGTYKSNLVVNCQICLAKYKSLLNFNTANVPSEIIDWVANPNITFNSLIKEKKIYILRGRDSMAHIMKGNIGLFISQGDTIIVNNLEIGNIDNKAKVSTNFGMVDEFLKLSSSYGILISGSKNLIFENIKVNEIKSDYGNAETISFKNNCCNFKILNE